MHYKNGREAKQGDTILIPETYGRPPVIGVIVGYQAGSTSCNLNVVPSIGGQMLSCISASDCLHVQDALRTPDQVPDFRAPATASETALKPST